MKVNHIQNNNKNPNFSGFYNNKILVKGLELASDNGAVFGAATAFTLATFIRPLAILSTPKAEKENKQYACAKSIASSFTNLGLMAIITMPVVKAIKNIEKTPQKFLKKETIKNLQGTNEILKNSKQFGFATQFFKLASGFLTSIPKTLITCILIPPIMLHFFGKQNPENKQKNDISFTGQLPIKSINFTEKISKGIGNILNKKTVQNFIQKYNDTNLAQHIFSIHDIINTGLFSFFVFKNRNIKETRKQPLIANSIISTGLTIISGYGVSKLLEKPTQKFIENFKNANKNLSNLSKYEYGIKNAKAAIILGGLYYIVTPIIATMTAEKFNNKV